MNDADTCERCDAPIGWDQWVELPCGGLLHRHCERDHNEDRASLAMERAAEGYSGEEYRS
jgi:hypothetical protein